MAVVKNWKFIHKILNKPAFRWVSLAITAAALGLFLFAQLRGKASGIGLLEGSLLGIGIVFLTITLRAFTRSGPSPLEGSSFRNSLSQMDWQHAGTVTLLFLGILDLPFVVFTITLSGLNFPHYYISLFTPLFLLLAGGVAFAHDILRHSSHQKLFSWVFAALIVAGAVFPVLQIAKRLQLPGGGDARSVAAAYLNTATAPQDKILVWGWESVIYFLADREAPTRYAFQFPAYLASPYQQAVQETLLQDIQTKPPRYIADTNDPEMPFIQGQTTAACLSANPVDGDKLQQILNYVCTNYHFEKSIDNINLYRLNQ